MSESSMTVFRCREDLLNEVDAIAKANYMERTDMIILASHKLLRFMESHSLIHLTDGPSPEWAAAEVLLDLEGMSSLEPEPRDPSAPMVEPLADGEADGIMLMERPKPRRRGRPRKDAR